MSVKEITNENFEKEILQSDKIALVDFYADWCGPCKMMSPVVEEIARENSDITVGKVNVDSSAELALKFGVMSIPTLIAFKDGKILNQMVGYSQKDEVLSMLGK